MCLYNMFLIFHINLLSIWHLCSFLCSMGVKLTSLYQRLRAQITSEVQGTSYWLIKQYVRTLRSGRPILEDTQDSCKYQVSKYISTVHQAPSWSSNLNEFNVTDVTIWKLFTMHGGSTFSTPRVYGQQKEGEGGLMRVKSRRKQAESRISVILTTKHFLCVCLLHLLS